MKYIKQALIYLTVFFGSIYITICATSFKAYTSWRKIYEKGTIEYLKWNKHDRYFFSLLNSNGEKLGEIMYDKESGHYSFFDEISYEEETIFYPWGWFIFNGKVRDKLDSLIPLEEIPKEREKKFLDYL